MPCIPRLCLTLNGDISAYHWNPKTKSYLSLVTWPECLKWTVKATVLPGTSSSAKMKDKNKHYREISNCTGGTYHHSCRHVCKRLPKLVCRIICLFMDLHRMFLVKKKSVLGRSGTAGPRANPLKCEFYCCTQPTDCSTVRQNPTIWQSQTDLCCPMSHGPWQPTGDVTASPKLEPSVSTARWRVLVDVVDPPHDTRKAVIAEWVGSCIFRTSHCPLYHHFLEIGCPLLSRVKTS